MNMYIKNTALKQLTTLLMLPLLLACFGASADSLEAEVDRTTIAINEAVQLNITYSGSSSDDINANVLGNDFDILSNSKSSSTQVTFGGGNAFSSSTQWNILLRPKRTGQLTIPAFVIDGTSSSPIVISVKAAAAKSTSTSSQRNAPIYLETDLSKARPFEQEQVLLTIRLVSEYNIIEHDFDQHDPIIPDAKIERVYAGQYRRQSPEGRQQVVLEKAYAIFPQSAGALTIPAVPQAVIYQEPSSDPRMSFFNRGNRVRKDFQSQVQTLHVQAKPDKPSPWLPAKKLTLTQHWSSSPSNFVVGEPITRDITITAEGLLASQLPELEIGEIEDIKLYPDQPQLNNDLSNSGVVGSRSLSTAIVISKPGRYTLPAIRVQWWDLNNKQIRSATLPAEEIVVAAPYGQAVEQQPTASTTEIDINQAIAAEVAPIGKTSQSSNLWMYSNAFFAATTILFALLWGRAKTHTPPAPKSQVRNSEPNAQTTKQALQELHRHCESGLLIGVRKALIDWGRASWPDSSVQSLNDLQQILKSHDNSETLQALIAQLDASLYGNSDSDFHCADIYREARALATSKTKKKDPSDALAPLYKG